MNQNIILKKQVIESQSKLDAEKAWWENRRAGIQSEFMKELESDGKPVDAKRTGSESDDAVLVDSGGPQDSGVKKRKGKKPGPV